MEYRKSYFSQDEYNLRKSIFATRLDEAARLNAESDSATYGVTPFMDWTEAEMEASLYGLPKRVSGVERCQAYNRDDCMDEDEFDIDVTVQDSVDWRRSSWKPKDQGSCGSCWTFSTVGAIEGNFYSVRGEVVSLSEQELVDCAHTQDGDTPTDPYFENSGCGGGWMSRGLAYNEINEGQLNETNYVYKATDQSCQRATLEETKPVEGAISRVINMEVDSCSDLEKAVNVGPTAIAVTTTNWHLYTGGIVKESQCGGTQFDITHGVVAVGYDSTDDGTDFWIVRNSWGTRWGDNGHIYLEKGSTSSACAACSLTSFPVVSAS